MPAHFNFLSTLNEQIFLLPATAALSSTKITHIPSFRQYGYRTAANHSFALYVGTWEDNVSGAYTYIFTQTQTATVTAAPHD
jgi:hypothetical protein